MKWVLGGLLLVAALLSACGSAPQDEVLIAAASNDTNQRTTLSEGTWVQVQQVTITVEVPGYVFLSATGGEAVEGPLDDAGISPVAWIGVGEMGQVAPQTVSTVPVRFVHEVDYETDTYRVPAYSVGHEYRVAGPGTYTYVLYARAVGGERPIAILPGSLMALFVPETTGAP